MATAVMTSTNEKGSARATDAKRQRDAADKIKEIEQQEPNCKLLQVWFQLGPLGAGTSNSVCSTCILCQTKILLYFFVPGIFSTPLPFAFPQFDARWQGRQCWHTKKLGILNGVLEREDGTFFVFLSTFLFILICQLKLSHISQYITEGFMNKIVLLFLTPHDSCPAWIYSSLVLILKLKVNFTRMYNPYYSVPLDSIK